MANQSINNIEIPKEYIMIGNVVMIKQIHNTKIRPRNKVEFKRRSLKNIMLSELKLFKVKGTSITENNKIDDNVFNETENEMIENFVKKRKYHNKQ